METGRDVTGEASAWITWYLRQSLTQSPGYSHIIRHRCVPSVFSWLLQLAVCASLSSKCEQRHWRVCWDMSVGRWRDGLDGPSSRVSCCPSCAAPSCEISQWHRSLSVSLCFSSIVTCVLFSFRVEPVLHNQTCKAAESSGWVFFTLHTHPLDSG